MFGTEIRSIDSGVEGSRAFDLLMFRNGLQVMLSGGRGSEKRGKEREGTMFQTEEPQNERMKS